jgi:DNA-binding phage protein
MTDNLGRNIDVGMNSAEIKGLVESTKVGPEKPYNKTTSSNSQEKIAPEVVKKIEDLLKAIKQTLKEFVSNKKKTTPGRIGKNSEAAEKAIKKLADKGLKKGSIYTHDMYVEKMQKLMYLQMKKQTALMAGKKTGKISGGIKTAEAELEKITKDREKEKKPEDDLATKRSDELDKILEETRKQLVPLLLMDSFGKSVANLQEALMGFRATNVLFKDLVGAERQFTTDTRQIAFEIAGATKESRRLQRSFEDIGKTAEQTGFDRSTSQQAYLKMLKKGAKEQKTALSITKNQLNTEKMIGVQAGSLEDTFTNMSLQMGMNNSQMAQFGRGLLDVARNTGVSGEHLAKAVHSSENIMKNMRNTGTLTAKAASNVVGLMASAEKFGVGEFAQQFTDVLSQGMSGFIHADQKMQVILGQALGHNAELMEQMRNGTIMQTREGMRGLAQGMEDTLARFSGGRVRTAEDFAKLSNREKMLLNTRMKEATGRTATEFIQATKAIEENAKPLSEKLAKINEQKKKNLNLEERATLLEQERTLKTNTGLEALATFQDKIIANGGNFEEAFKSITTGEIGEDLKALGHDMSSGKTAMKGAMEQALQGLNEGLKKVGKSTVDISSERLEKALSSGDSKELEKIQQEMIDGQQKLAAAQKAQADPTTALNKTMQDLNDTLRGVTQGAISSMMNSVFGESLGILTTLVDVGGQFAGFTATSVLEYSKLKNSIQNLSADAASLLGPGGALGGMGATIASLAGPIAIATAAAVGLYGAFTQAAKSGEKAGEIFSKSMEDVTAAEYYAAKGAGFLTGPLNTITFGIFDYWIGATGVITKALAKFNKIIPIMSALMGIFDAIGGAIWGIITSIKDVVVGAFEMIYYAVSPIGEIFTVIGNAISDALGPLFNFGSKLSETGTIFQMFASIFGWFGKVIRNILVGIGKAIGSLVTIIVKVLTPIILVVGKAIKGLASVFGFFFERLYDYGRGLFLFFEGLFNLDFNKMGQGLWNMLTNALMLIPSLIWNLFTFAFKTLYIEIPKMLIGIPKMIFDAVWGGISSLAKNDWIGPIFQPFLDTMKPLYSAFSDLYRVFEELFVVLGGIFEPFNDLFAEFSKLFGFTGKAVGWMGVLKTAIHGIATVIGWFVQALLIPMQLVFLGLSSAIKLVIPFVKLLSDIFTVGIFKAFKNFGKNIWNAITGIFEPIGAFLWSLGESLLSPFKWLADVLVGHSIVPDLVSDIVMFFAKLPLEIMKNLVKIPFMLIDWVAQMFGFMPGAIGKALHSAASSIGLGWLVDNIMGTSGGVASSTPTPTESLASAATQKETKAALSGSSGTLAIEEKAERESVTLKSSAIGGSELESIASSNEVQVDKLDEMISLLSTMVEQLRPSSATGNSVAEAGSTAGERVITSPPKYYKWSVGKHNQTAALGVSNLANIG